MGPLLLNGYQWSVQACHLNTTFQDIVHKPPGSHGGEKSTRMLIA